MNKQKTTKNTFDFRKKSIKNLVCACIYLAAIAAYIPIMVIYQGKFLSISMEEQGPVLDMPILIGMSICSVISIVVGIMLLVYDINLARYARSSKTFGNPMISVLTFAFIPAICVAMSVFEYYILMSQMLTMMAEIMAQLGGGSQPDPEVLNGIVNSAFAVISNASIISSAVMGGIVVWQIALNSLNIHANR